MNDIPKPIEIDLTNLTVIELLELIRTHDERARYILQIITAAVALSSPSRPK